MSKQAGFGTMGPFDEQYIARALARKSVRVTNPRIRIPMEMLPMLASQANPRRKRARSTLLVDLR
ncbi:MAG: hypothetical protein IIB69_11925 [Proteobacteria bacterium]|nr:hypothetical protein [Pseudomonadota bacterium]